MFDGQKVFNTLKQNKGLWKPNKKYMIKYKGPIPSIFAGFNHKIDVLLPLSDTPYEEPLVDLYALDKIFKQHKMHRTEEKNFGDMMAEYNKDIQFNADDTTFISFYKYIIYTKSL